MSNRLEPVTGVIAGVGAQGGCDGVVQTDAVGLHLGPSRETTKTRAAIVGALDEEKRHCVSPAEAFPCACYGAAQ